MKSMVHDARTTRYSRVRSLFPLIGVNWTQTTWFRAHDNAIVRCEIRTANGEVVADVDIDPDTGAEYVHDGVINGVY